MTAIRRGATGDMLTERNANGEDGGNGFTWRNGETETNGGQRQPCTECAETQGRSDRVRRAPHKRRRWPDIGRGHESESVGPQLVPAADSGHGVACFAGHASNPPLVSVAPFLCVNPLPPSPPFPRETTFPLSLASKRYIGKNATYVPTAAPSHPRGRPARAD